MTPIRFTILGQPASKANSRQIVKFGKRNAIIKSKEARQFMDDARRQVPPKCRVRLQGPVAVVLHLHYMTERPDLDESIVLDALQDHYVLLYLPNGAKRRELAQPGVYVNDRQVREKHVYHHIDRDRPHVDVEIFSIAPTDDMFADVPAEPPLPF